MGRATQGVRLINLTKKNDVIASVCKVMTESEEEPETIVEPDDTQIVDPDESPNVENTENTEN